MSLWWKYLLINPFTSEKNASQLEIFSYWILKKTLSKTFSGDLYFQLLLMEFEDPYTQGYLIVSQLYKNFSKTYIPHATDRILILGR
jgi:hypothetical protein